MTTYPRAEARAYCGGSFAPYAKSLAISGTRALLDDGGFRPFFAIGTEHGDPLLIVPEPESEELVFTIFYCPKLHNLPADMLATLKEADTLIHSWRLYCTAYVKAVIDLNAEKPFYCLDHNATAKAADALFNRKANEGHDVWWFDLMIEDTLEFLRGFNQRRYRRDIEERFVEMHANKFYKPN